MGNRSVGWLTLVRSSTIEKPVLPERILASAAEIGATMVDAMVLGSSVTATSAAGGGAERSSS